MSSGVTRLDSGAWGVRVAIGVKATLALAFVVALTVPLEHLDGKGMGFVSRCSCFLPWWFPSLGGGAALSLILRLRDVLIVLPFLLDTLGNLVGSYDTFAVTDDVLHTLNWVLLVSAFHAWRSVESMPQVPSRKPTPGCWEPVSARWPSSVGRSPSGSWLRPVLEADSR